jgi:hypothetical protein
MKSFQDLLGWSKGTTEVIVTKKLALGDKDIQDIQGREEKILTYLFRKRYRQENNRLNNK